MLKFFLENFILIETKFKNKVKMSTDIKKLLEENREELILLLKDQKFINGLKDMDFFTSDDPADMEKVSNL